MKAAGKDVAQAAARGAVSSAGAAIRSKIPKRAPAEPEPVASSVTPWLIGGGVAVVAGLLFLRGRS